jgi:Putative esterase
MTSKLAVGLLLALGSAAALNWGYYAQHGAAGALPPLSLRRPFRSLALLFRDRRWLLGFATGLGGWALYVAALALAPLSLVQAASAGGIALLAGLVGRLTRSERAAVAVAFAGLVLLGLSLIGARTTPAGTSWQAVAAWMGGSAALALTAVVAAPRTRAAAGVGYGIAAGCLYAAGDVGTKAAVAGGGRLGFVPALLACHGLAFVVLQLGFQRGGALATAGMATLWTNALPIAAGTIVFHERVPPGAGGAARILAFGAVVAAAALLTRPPAAARQRSTTPARSERRLLRWVAALFLVSGAAVPGGLAAAGTRGSAPAPIPGFSLLARDPDGGTVWTGRIRNPFVPMDARLSDIYLPPGYSAGGRYPVLYLLHGFWGSPSSFVAGFRLGETADALIARGEARPFITVMPPGGPATKTANDEWAGVWERYVLERVIPWTDAHLSTLRAADARAIGGLSAGGFGAVDMALRSPGTFGVAEAWGGYFRPFRDGPFLHASPAVLAAHNPTLLIRDDAAGVRRSGLRFFLSTAGSHGPVARRWTFEFARELTSLRIPHRLWVMPAGKKHFGRTQLPDALRYAERPG